MTQQARFATFHSTRSDSSEMLDELAGQLDSADISPSLVLVFLAEHTEEAFSELAKSLRGRFPQGELLGCSVQGTICNGQELESGPSAVVWAGELPDVEIGSFHLNFQRTSEGAAFAGEGDLADLSEWEPADSALIALGDPYTFPMDVYLERLREEAPMLPVVGGMASGGAGPGLTLLMRNGELVNHGAMFVSLRNRRTDGMPRFSSVVSQGCRPIGEPFVVTSAERNQVFGLGGKPAVEQLLRIYRELPTQEQRMLQKGLHLGIAVDEYRDRFGFGDFLIRNVMQLNQDEGYLVVGDFVRVGQTVQFHLRDEVSAAAELKMRLKQMLADLQPQRPAGALLFSCNGRGQNLFSTPHHDAQLIQSTVGEIPLAGFFAAGEIGPVSGVNFVHGYTASGLFFRA
jgi:small ligand-binding sensory domain FIST